MAETEEQDSLFGIPMPYLYAGLVASVILAGTWFMFLQPTVSTSATTEGVQNQCTDLCTLIEDNSGEVKEAYKLQYCTQAYDLGDGQQTVNGTTVCSSGTHCFNLDSCNAEGIELDASQCKEFVYSYYQEYNNENANLAAQHVVDTYGPSNNETGVGQCNLDETWYADNFASTEAVKNE